MRPTAIPSPSTSGDPENPGGYTHIPALDGIRGLAILLVLSFHLLLSNPITGSPIFNVINAFINSFYIGVNLFFVLSGFLITGILLDTLDQPHFFKTFYARRTLRIFPLYYGFLFLLLLLTKPLHFVWNGWQYYFLAYIANMALWRTKPLLLDPFTIDHFWSLQVEEQFYLIWPFLIFRIRSLKTLITVSLAACFASLLFRIILVYLRPHIQNVHVVHSTTPACADNLLFGCCLCALLRTSARQQILKLAPRVFAIGAAILLCTGIVYHGLRWQDNFFVPTFGFTIVGISCTALLAMALRTGSRTQAIFANKTMRFFGKYSYGLYVFHYSIDRMLTPHVRLYINNHFHSKALAVLGGAAAVMAITLPVALLSFHFYEAPFLKLKRFFSYNQKAASTV